MKTLKIILAFCLLLGTGFTYAQRVVIIGLDGLSVEGFHTAKTPNLDKLFSKGALSINTRAVMPSVTLPNWTSHLTSGGPEQHGATSNSWRIDNQPFPPIERDEEGYYPSIFKLVKDQVPNVKTAYYYNWANLINSMNQKYFDEVNFLEADGYKENYNKTVSFLKQNSSSPSLVFLYSVHTDHAGHTYNWMSTEYISAIEEADVVIGEFIQNLKDEKLYKDTHFLLITDHGGTRTTGHGGTSIEEMEVPWGIVGPTINNLEQLTSPNSNANTAAVLAKIFNCKTLPESWIGRVPKSIFRYVLFK